MRKITLFLSLLLTTVMTTFAQDFADGVYKIYWDHNDRGYMCFHGDYPTEAKLADVELSGYQSIHFSTATDPVNVNWYLITGPDGTSRYLFHAEAGLFLNVSDVAADEAKANVLSETPTTTIEIVANSTADYTLYGTSNGIRYFLSSGCGQPSTTGHPVRWSTKTADLSDGGTPLKLVPVDGVEVNEEVMGWIREALGFETEVAPVVTAEVNDATMGTATVETLYDSATFTATANEGYVFVHWANGDEVVSTENPYETVFDSDLTLTAVFEAEAVEPVVDLYRVKTDAGYLNISNYLSHPTGPAGGVNVVDFADSDDQVFTMEDAGNGQVYLKSVSGYYIYCIPNGWNVDGSADNKTALTFESNGENTFYIKQAGAYFKVENVNVVPVATIDGVQVEQPAVSGWYPFCDAAVGAAATWSLEKVEDEVVPPAEPDAAVVAEVEALLALDGVGYPKRAERVKLQDALDAYTGDVNSETLAALQAQIESYYAATNVNLPEAGKWYTITAVAPNGKEFYFDYNDTELILTERTEDTVIPASAQFKFEQFGPGRFRVMANDSIYLVYSHGTNYDASWMTGESHTGVQNKNDVDAVDEMGQITFSRIDASAENVSATSKELFGLMQWNSPRGTRTDNSEFEPGCLTIKADAGDFDASGSPFFKLHNGAYFTSALRIEPAVFPPLGASEPVTIDLINDTWTPALPSGYASATYSTKEYNNGTHTIKITDNGSCYIENGQAYRLSGNGSKITLPAFDFDVAKIEVIGHETAAASYATSSMNVFVGTTAVSTACYGSTGTNTFAIAADNQAAGNEYVLKVGNDGSKTIFITAIKVYPASALEGPVFSVEGGVYPSAKSMTVSTPSASIKGVTRVDYYYTTDGTEPNDKSQKAYSGSLTVNKSCTVKAIAYLTYNDEKVATPVTSQTYIISENVPYEKAAEVVAGNYLIAARTNVAVPYVDGASTKVIKTTAVTVNGNYIETAAYFGFSFEATDGGFHIKDANGKYLAASAQLVAAGTAASNIKLIDQPGITEACVWNVAIADGVATITCAVESMGATATGVLLYNSANKAFELYDQAAAPMTLEKPVLYTAGAYPELTWTPAPGESVSELKEFTFVCEQGLAFNVEAGQVVLNNYELVDGVEKTNTVVLTPTTKDANTVVLAASDALTAYGDYQLLVPAGYFILAPNGLAMACKEFGEMYTIADPDAFMKLETVTPTNGSTVESLSRIVLTYAVDEYVAQIYNTKLDVKDADGNVVTTASCSFKDENGGWYSSNVASFVLAEEITTPGTYTMVIPEMYFYGNDFPNAETKLTYTVGGAVTPSVPSFAVSAALFPAPLDPANITEIKAIRVQHNEGPSIEELPTNWTLTDADGNEVMINVSWGMSNFEDIMIIPAGTITTPGTYTLTIPAGSIKTDGGVKEVEAATFSWTVAGTVVEPEALEITNVSPEDGSVVESIKKIDITFNKDIKASNNLYPDDPYPVYKEGAGMFPAEMGSWSINGNVLTITLPNALTDAGVYIVKFAAELFVDAETGATIDGDKEFRITVKSEPVDTSIDGVDAEVEQVIYDITGRRINEITSAGVYIVNGVKVLVK